MTKDQEITRLKEALRELLAAQHHYDTIRTTSCGDKLDRARDRLSEAEAEAETLAN